VAAHDATGVPLLRRDRGGDMSPFMSGFLRGLALPVVPLAIAIEFLRGHPHPVVSVWKKWGDMYPYRKEINNGEENSA
jgi:hypothetical protein